MILTRMDYRGQDIEIRSEQPGAPDVAARHAQVWVDGESLAAPQPCRDTGDLAHLLDEALSRIDAMHA